MRSMLLTTLTRVSARRNCIQKKHAAMWILYGLKARKGKFTIRREKYQIIIKNGWKTYREQLLYLFFGVLTTLINYGAFWLLNRLSQGHAVLLVNLLAFTAATAFAYAANKLYVFQSRQRQPGALFREAVSFVAVRLFSFAVEEAGLYVCVYILFLGRYGYGWLDGVALSKIALSILAVVLNYFFSKFWVFSSKEQKK